MKGQTKSHIFSSGCVSNNIQDRHMVTLNHGYFILLIKSYIIFHLPFYLFLDDPKRSNQRHIFSMGRISKTVQDKHITIKHGYRKSHMRFHLVPFYFSLGDLKRSNQRHI